MFLDICCLLETRFRGESVKIISEKAAQYKLLWIGNGKGSVGISSDKKRVDKAVNTGRVSD